MQSYTSMTLEEQLGQLFVVGFWGTTPSPEIIDLIQNYHIGGIILFSRNISDPQQVLELTESLQRSAKDAGHRHPLLIAIDHENGMVQRLGKAVTQFPGNMALGAIGSEQIAYAIAQATGRELKALGINMNLAPVVDVNNNPANPVIGIRSFGEDPLQVARLATATVKGYQAAGIISSLKHFPGHGDTAVDSHYALPTISSTLQRLEEVELVPFRSGIEAGAPSVMIAHIHFPSLMQDKVLPATVSSAVISELLRKQLGYDGVIISDCLEMKAIADTLGVERGAIMVLQASSDLVLISHHYTLQRAGIEAVRSAVQSGELSPEMIRQAVGRVLRLKERFLPWDDIPASTVPAWVGGKEHQELRDRAYNLSTTLVRNDAALLPLRLEANERILVVFQQTDTNIVEGKHSTPDELLLQAIRQYHAHVDTLSLSSRRTAEEYQQVLRRARESDVIIMPTVDAFLDQQQAEPMNSLIQTGQRVVGIAVRNPYDLLAFPQLRTYLVTYEYTQPALAAAVRVLFGEIQPQGRLPVTLPALYPLGHQASIY